MWAATSGKWSFVITYDQGDFVASYKDAISMESQSANYLDENPFATFSEAEDACNAVAKQLRKLS